MKVPSIPLTVIYKVVQRFEGKLYSYNQIIHNSYGDAYPAVIGSDEVVEYKFRHQVFPNTSLKTLFACKTRKCASKMLREIDDRRGSYCIIRCYGFNVREVDCLTFHKDPAVKPVSANVWVSLPLGVRTVLCDWLIPVSIIKPS